jgi:hypothetical protein
MTTHLDTSALLDSLGISPRDVRGYLMDIASGRPTAGHERRLYTIERYREEIVAAGYECQLHLMYDTEATRTVAEQLNVTLRFTKEWV